MEPSHPAKPARVLVLGLGNDVLGDDAAGLLVARNVHTRLAGHPEIAVRDTTEMGLALLDEIVGHEHVILIDAVETGTAAPGQLHEFPADTLIGRRISAPHFVGVAETLAIGRLLGVQMPSDVTVFGIEVEGPFRVTTEISDAVGDGIARATERVAECALELAAATGVDAP